jgi:hypothetical protein
VEECAKHKAYRLLLMAFLLALHFDPENGEDIIFQNVGIYPNSHGVTAHNTVLFNVRFTSFFL